MILTVGKSHKKSNKTHNIPAPNNDCNMNNSDKETNQQIAAARAATSDANATPLACDNSNGSDEQMTGKEAAAVFDALAPKTISSKIFDWEASSDDITCKAARKHRNGDREVKCPPSFARSQYEHRVDLFKGNWGTIPLNEDEVKDHAGELTSLRKRVVAASYESSKNKLMNDLRSNRFDELMFVHPESKQTPHSLDQLLDHVSNTKFVVVDNHYVHLLRMFFTKWDFREERNGWLHAIVQEEFRKATGCYLTLERKNNEVAKIIQMIKFKKRTTWNSFKVKMTKRRTSPVLLCTRNNRKDDCKTEHTIMNDGQKQLIVKHLDRKLDAAKSKNKKPVAVSTGDRNSINRLLERYGKEILTQTIDSFYTTETLEDTSLAGSTDKSLDGTTHANSTTASFAQSEEGTTTISLDGSTAVATTTAATVGHSESRSTSSGQQKETNIRKTPKKSNKTASSNPAGICPMAHHLTFVCKNFVFKTCDFFFSFSPKCFCFAADC